MSAISSCRNLMLLSGMMAFLAFVPAAAQGFDAAEENRIKALALEAILENPEILQKAIALLQEKQKKEQAEIATRALATKRAQLERDPNAPVLGNPEGDVTVTEFFDYNCPYCKRAVEPVRRLLDDDDGVRLVYREWPILGDASVFAARAALAARAQGKYEEMHWALMNQRRVTVESTLSAATRIGLDIEQLKNDMDAPEIDEHIRTSMSLARDLGFSGTPSFVVGNELVPGLVSFEALASLVDQARQNYDANTSDNGIRQ